MKLVVDVLLFGGGCAGLWLLDALRRAGFRAVLVDSQPLGAGQTGMAQGILHSGLKYLLHKQQASLANEFYSFPEQWRRSLRGEQEPDLRGLQMRAEYCYLWRTDSLRSKLSLLGARAGLQTRPIPVERRELPAVLARCPGTVYRLDEPVIDTYDFVCRMAERNAGRLWHVDADLTQFAMAADGTVRSVSLTAPVGTSQPGSDASSSILKSPRTTTVAPRAVVLAAGEGNEQLRRQAGLPEGLMQRRPLHVPFVVGRLPRLNGHCVDGAGARVTITSNRPGDEPQAWQLGGRISEVGVEMDEAELIALGQSELAAVLPGLSLDGCRWFTRRVNRAEARSSTAGLPAGAQVVREGAVFTVWPTKLVLAPALPNLIVPHLPPPEPGGRETFESQLADTAWPAPPLAPAAWEHLASWKCAA